MRSINSKKGIDIVVAVIILHSIMSYSALFMNDLRYLKYTLPLLVLLLRNRRSEYREQPWTRKTKEYILNYFKFYIPTFFLFFLVQGFKGEVSFRFWANISFVLLPLILIWLLAPLVRPNRVKYYIFLLCYSTVLGFIIEQRNTIIPTITGISKILTGISDSELDTESNIYSYLLALLLLFSVYFKYPNHLKLLLLFCVILSFKRIIFLSLFIVAIISKMSFLTNYVTKNKKLSATIFAILSSIIIFNYFFLVQGYFDEFIFNNIGLSTDALLKGRQKLYTLALSDFDENSILWGNGIGYIDDLLRNNLLLVNNVKNLHSELLRWFIETGSIVYFLWIFFLFKNSAVGKYAIISFIFIFIMLLTDNVFIYFDTMFYFYLLTILSFVIEAQGRMITNSKKHLYQNMS
jgi:hypothetical protein